MRPFVFHPNVVVPDAPATVTVYGSTVTWIDTTPVGGQDAQGIPTAGTNAAYPTPTSSPKNEIGYKIFVNAAPRFRRNKAPIPANVTLLDGSDPGISRAASTVVAYNAAGDSEPGTALTTTAASVDRHRRPERRLD